MVGLSVTTILIIIGASVGAGICLACLFYVSFQLFRYDRSTELPLRKYSPPEPSLPETFTTQPREASAYKIRRKKKKKEYKSRSDLYGNSEEDLEEDENIDDIEENSVTTSSSASSWCVPCCRRKSHVYRERKDTTKFKPFQDEPRRRTTVVVHNDKSDAHAEARDLESGDICDVDPVEELQLNTGSVKREMTAEEILEREKRKEKQMKRTRKKLEIKEVFVEKVIRNIYFIFTLFSFPLFLMNFMLLNEIRSKRSVILSLDII